jgi:hypothetical protein
MQLSRPIQSYLLAFMVVSALSNGAIRLHGQSPRNSAFINSHALNSNISFEDGVVGWNEQQIESEVLTRDWIPTAANSDVLVPYESAAHLETKLVRLRGEGQWGQIFSIPASQKHVLNIHAFRQATVGAGPGSFAAARVSYYNDSWSLLDTIEIPIGGRDLRWNRGIGDGMNFYSWGIDVPVGATSAHLYIYNSEDTEVYMDAFGLFEYTQTSSLSVAKNLIINPRMATYFNPTINIRGAQGFGIEFWEVETEWSRGLNLGSFGSTVQPESAYQTVPLLPKRTYTLRFDGGFPDVAAAAVGVDFFDANWKKLGGKSFVSVSDQYSYVLRMETPANMVHAQAYYWCDTLSPQPFLDSLYGTITLQEQTPVVNSATSIILAESFPNLSPKYGDRIGSSFMVIFSDANGIASTSINSSNVVFRSRSNPTKTYAASLDPGRTVISQDGKVVLAKYDVFAGYEDVGAVVVRGKQVTDKLGNFSPTKTFQVDVP